MTDRATTRRELLRGGGGAAVGDGPVLASLLRVEQVIVLAYERALAGGVLTTAAQQLVSEFLAHERAHVHALSVNLAALGASVPAAPRSTAAFESELRRLRVRRSPAELRNERDHLRFLIALETRIARHYRFAIARLAGAKQISLAAEMMANEAQHATILRELLSPGNARRAVPTGFVAGTT